MDTDETTFAGRVVVVTGGRSGIGAAVVRALLAGGAGVASLDVAPSSGQGHERLLELVCNVAEPASVDEAIVAVLEHFGRLDGLVQSAGITRDGVLWKMAAEDWQAVLDVNLSGAFHVLKAAVPHMRAQEGGSVVHISSINGERGKFGQSNYAASKAGLIALTKTAARELGAFGIRVNAVAPGMVRTPMTEGVPAAFLEKAVAESALGRIAEAEDVAAAALFLLSDQARQITGVTLRVDGGQYM